MYRFVLKAHRLLGQGMCLLLLMWFLSAFVIIYHEYPSYSPQERASHALPLPEEVLPLLATESLAKLEPSIREFVPNGSPYSLSLEHTLPYGVHYRLSSSDGVKHLGLDGEVLTPRPFSREGANAVARLWQSEVLSIDTIADLDQWTPFSRLREDLPFYRLNLSGEEKRQVYVSSLDGRILTEHTQSERIFAYLGAIPHWVYFTQLRSNADLWRWVVAILAGIGTIMTLTGLWIGISVYLSTRKSQRGIHSPYTKRWFWLHHTLGTLFGVFILTWVFSGMMSVLEVPRSLSGYGNQEASSALRGHTLEERSYQALGDLLGERLPSERKLSIVSWTSLGTYPIVSLTFHGGESQVFDASSSRLKPLVLSSESILTEVRRAFGEENNYQIQKLEGYDSYYLARGGELSLPVYRVIVSDEQAHHIYVNPSNGSLRVLDRQARMRMWVYTKLHGLKFVGLVEHNALWSLIVWGLLGIGTLVSLSGLMMWTRRLRRTNPTKK